MIRLNDSNMCLQADLVDRQLKFEDHCAQAVCVIIAAAAVCQTPVLVDLTDGELHNLLQLEGDALRLYQNCSPRQVMLKVCCCNS